MFRLAADVQVYLHREPIDFRAGINSLAVLVQETMALDPFVPAVFASCNRRHDRVKLLFFDRSGFVLVLKRLTEDKFRWPRRQEAVVRLTTNMRAVRTFIDKYRASTRVWAGHHIYKSNQDQVPAVRQFCQELGFAYHPIAAFYMPLERLMDHLQGKANPNDQGIVEDLLYHPAERQKAAAAGRSRSFDCELRFNQTVINHDGSVALCCTVYDKENMLDTQFLEADFAEIERRKYAHPFCETCFKQHLEYAPFHLEACENV
jgi:transposase